MEEEIAQRWSALLITSCQGYIALIELSTDVANLHLLARLVFARFVHWSVVFLSPSIFCYLETNHQVQPILKGVGMELSSTSYSGRSIYIYKEDAPLLPYIFNIVIYLYHCGLMCLFYTRGYKPVLCYFVAEIVSASVGDLSAWLLCSFNTLPSFCF